jgi:peptidoglycan hydrolase-like protein with peptidoglycan-binding domain
MHPTLRLGSSGAAVVELQTKLNRRPPSSFPPLDADGMFGNRTLARVREFQSRQSLAADGVVGQQTWAALDQGGGGPGAVPPVQVAPDPRAQGALTIAKPIATTKAVDYSIIDPAPLDGPHGWRLLGQMILSATGQLCTEAELRKNWNPRGIQWCGIFCVYCYQMGGAPNVTWSFSLGAFGGGPTGFKKHNGWEVFPHSKFEDSVVAGDIGVVAALSHHFLIESIDKQARTMVTMEGNTVFGRTVRRTDRKLSELVAYYRII